ncbi:unnamed protein product [Rangifer tarandus platyrhynchus]|uniref:Uncharacterized protein n=1 Tax=Rangifer tarandus platyrhynchus TaxID=3082113 RepID=A0AC59Z158_RANTA
MLHDVRGENTVSPRLDQWEEVIFETDVKGGIQFQSSGVVRWGWGAGGRNIFRAATAKVKTEPENTHCDSQSEKTNQRSVRFTCSFPWWPCISYSSGMKLWQCSFNCKT